MSREIKFRIWNGQEYVTEPVHWDYEYFVDPLDGEVVTVNTSWEGGGKVDCLRSQGYEIEQFTGLKDARSFDIYEGDILEKEVPDYGEAYREWMSREGDDWNLKDEPKKKIIDYCTLDRFRFWLSKESFGDEGEDLEDPETWTIIGNIREHKHLLS